ncbi:hypothetical protein NUQ38_10790, partial [Glaesserella parasuis]|nr:hypothetical protein [Glaesserella parasuis]
MKYKNLREFLDLLE